MERNNNGHKLNDPNLPDLGNIRRVVPEGTRGPVGVQVRALVRCLDENGQIELEIVNTPNGPVGKWGRGDFASAEDLVEMMRLMVREELQAVRLAEQEALANDPVIQRLFNEPGSDRLDAAGKAEP